MSNISVYSSLPRTNFRGTNDQSAVAIAMPVSSLPIQLPLLFSLAPWGEEDRARFVNADAINLLYGNEVIDPKSPYFTHQSQFLLSNFTSGASAMFLRLVSPDAKRGSIRFGIDIVADEIPEYERNPDGSYRRNAQGAKIATGEMIEGYRVKIVKMEIPTINGVFQYGIGAPFQGSMVSSIDGSTSTVYPFFDGTARFRGARADNLGLRLFAPTVASSEPADEAKNERVGSYLFRVQEVQRASATSTAQIVPTIDGAKALDVSFVKRAEDPSTRVVYDIRKNMLKAYEGDTAETFAGWGHFEKFHIFDANLNTVLNMLAAAETTASAQTVSKDFINFLTGVDVEGIPYHSFVVEGPETGGLLMTENTAHYFMGGSDGDIGPEAYNQLVDEMLSDLPNFQVPFSDIAKYPFNSVWDSGFPLETKLKMSAFHNLRPDVFVAACTQDVSLPINTPAEDSAILVALRTQFRAQQESAEFGTKAYRFFVQGNAGYLISDQNDALVPFLEDTLIRLGSYMGAGSGVMTPANAFGRGGQNVISRYRDHNVVSRQEGVKNIDWSNGLTYAESFDIDRIFVPGYQSMYEDKTSVCQGLINMVILCNLTRIGHIVWRNWTGDSQLTDDEFAEAIVADVRALTNGRYDSRANIDPQCYYTKLDADQGFAWHLDIHAGLENMRTVQHLAIIANRRRGEA